MLTNIFFFGSAGGMLLSTVLTRLNLTSAYVNFLLFTGFLVLGVAAGFLGIFVKPSISWVRYGNAAFFLLFLALLIPAIYKARATGPLHDATNRPEAPPEFLIDKRTDSRFTAELAELQQRYHGTFPKVELQASITVDDISGFLQKNFGWEQVAREADRVQLVARTGFFRFEDDVLLVKNGSELVIRSRSRVGEYDFGANAARVLRLIIALNALEK